MRITVFVEKPQAGWKSMRQASTSIWQQKILLVNLILPILNINYNMFWKCRDSYIAIFVFLSMLFWLYFSSIHLWPDSNTFLDRNLQTLRTLAVFHQVSMQGTLEYKFKYTLFKDEYLSKNTIYGKCPFKDASLTYV